MTLSASDVYVSIDELPLYNFDMYRKTIDLNWFVKGYTGKETKIAESILKPAEEAIIEQYYTAIDDRSYQLVLQKYAKISVLQAKYFVVSEIIKIMAKGFSATKVQQECRAILITELAKHSFKMELIADPYADYERLTEISGQLQAIKTQINVIGQALKTEGVKASVSLNKQVILVGIALQMPYRINIKETTVSDWIEMVKLCDEKAKQN